MSRAIMSLPVSNISSYRCGDEILRRKYKTKDKFMHWKCIEHFPWTFLKSSSKFSISSKELTIYVSIYPLPFPLTNSVSKHNERSSEWIFDCVWLILVQGKMFTYIFFSCLFFQLVAAIAEVRFVKSDFNWSFDICIEVS